MDLLGNGGSLDKGVSVSESVVHWVEVWIDWCRWVLDLLGDRASFNKSVSISKSVVHWVEVWINWGRWVLNLFYLGMSTSGFSSSGWIKSIDWDQWLGLSNGASLNESISISEPVIHWVEVWIDLLGN